jgi:two-component system sensor histidine kinase QseC
LNAEQRSRLGERFYRPLGSEESGSGLGWSIVKRITAVHGAQLHADMSPALGGLRVEVRFPAAVGQASAGPSRERSFA